MGNVKTKSASGKKAEKNRCLSHYWVPNISENQLLWVCANEKENQNLINRK